LRSLLHKEGNWVDWGLKCQQLQKAGFGTQTIFEQTGFQSVQQNLIIVSAQVFENLRQAEVDPGILAYYQGAKSDVLYELRILNQSQRAEAAVLAYEKRLEFDGAKQLAKAIQSYGRAAALPREFSTHPGDVMAYQCWLWARQKRDLQERSRLIAQGLKFAQTVSAREEVEKLLSDFTLVAVQKAPLLPVYRLKVEEEIARIIPIVGTLPLTPQALAAVATVEILQPFRQVSYAGQGQLVPLPGWQAVLKAGDPVAILTSSDRLPQAISNQVEELLVVVDRASQVWDVNSYFIVDQEGQISIQWFEKEPTLPILGQVVLILRPKRIVDENNLLEPWQMDD
jgi:hypothetical protein